MDMCRAYSKKTCCLNYFAQPQILVLTKQSTFIQYLMSMRIYKTVENAKIFSTSLTSDTPRFTSSQFTVRSPLSYPLLWKRIVHINRCLQDLERERERRKVGLLTHEICIKSCECRASHVSS